MRNMGRGKSFPLATLPLPLFLTTDASEGAGEKKGGIEGKEKGNRVERKGEERRKKGGSVTKEGGGKRLGFTV